MLDLEDVLAANSLMTGDVRHAHHAATVSASESGGRRTAALHIPSLDGLRAVSFLIVFLAHSGIRGLVGIPGGFGVTVFFYLSGFLITTLMRMERQATGTVNLRHFYLRRALRILPPFYLILFFACSLTLFGLLPGQLSPTVVLAQSLHVSNYWFIWNGAVGSAAGTVPYWSLAVEEHFYMLFPVLYLGLARVMSRHAQARSVLACCALICVWRCLLVGVFGVNDDRTYMGSDTRFDSIFFGCALAIGMNPVLDAPHGSERLWKWLLFPAALALLICTFAFRAEWFRETIRYTLQGRADAGLRDGDTFSGLAAVSSHEHEAGRLHRAPLVFSVPDSPGLAVPLRIPAAMDALASARDTGSARVVRHRGGDSLCG